MSIRISKQSYVAHAAIAYALLSAGVAHAQTEPQTAPAAQQQSGLGDIVVTAQKRSQNLQDVPIAISAFTAEAMAERGISDVSSLAKLSPNVTLDSGSFAGGSASVLSAFIRGIGQSDFAFNFDPGVGVYLDGVYLGRTIGANVGLFDVERVEVLKGPQGTLFGRNTIGGAVSIVTASPGDELHYSGEVTTGRYNRIDTRGMISGPLSDTLGASFAFGTKKRNGYMKRQPFDTTGFFTDSRYFADRVSAPDTEGGQDEYNLRGKLKWNPTDKFDAVLAADYTKINTSNLPQTLLGVDPAAGLGGLYNLCIATPSAVLDGIGFGQMCGPRARIGTSLAGANADADPNNDRIPYDGRFITGDKDASYSTGNSFERTKSYGGSLTMTYDLAANMSLKSITGYRKLDFASGADGDGSPLQILEINSAVKQDQFSEELQLTGNVLDGAINYVLGAYYFDEDSSTNDYVMIGELLGIYAPADLSVKAKAVYGQVDWRLNEMFGVTLGARYTEEKKDIFVGQSDLLALTYKLAAGAGVPGCFPITDACRVLLGFPDPANPLAYAPPEGANDKFSNFSPKVGVQMHLDSDRMLYASWSKGYKSGGWTTRLSNPVSVLPGFSPEKAETSELGLKADFFDNRVRFNGAVFYTDYKGIQLNFQEGVSPVIKNAGDAEIYGFDGDMAWIVTDNFTLRGALGYVHNEYKRLDPGAIGITVDSKLPKTPEWKFAVSPELTIPLANDASILVLADYSHSSSTFNDAENTLGIKKAAIDDLSASITYKAPENWRVTVGATNLLNDRYLTAGQNQLGGVGMIYGTYNRPQEWYATLRIDF